jgi:general secretion pathway protein G
VRSGVNVGPENAVPQQSVYIYKGKALHSLRKGCAANRQGRFRVQSHNFHDPDMIRTVSRRSRNRKGFTLIEILVVIVVIAILATLVAPNIFQNVGAAKSATAKSQIEMLGAALDAYRLDNGAYPTTQQGLNALWEKPTIDPPANWRAPYLRKAVPMDPWGRAYVYVFPGEQNPNGYDLISYGADGVPGGEGENADILSWK